MNTPAGAGPIFNYFWGMVPASYRIPVPLLFFILAFCLLVVDANGQRLREEDSDLVQFSGIVRDLQHRPLPDVNIIILNNRRGTTSDNRGMFSFIVHPNDTILFSHLGHKGTIHVIPDSLAGHQYPADIFMVSDTFKLAEVRIYPWKTYQEFKEAFLALDLPDDDEERAYQNIALIKTQIKMNRDGLAPSPTINFREVMKQEYNQLYTAGQSPYFTIFDPLRWARFFDALKKGEFKQDE
jgi:hypothetical protein